MWGAERHVESVSVRCRFNGDGSWSSTVTADGVPELRADAPTGMELMRQVAAILEDLALRLDCSLRVVHDLDGDVRAFSVIAEVEGFADRVFTWVLATEAASCSGPCSVRPDVS